MIKIKAKSPHLERGSQQVSKSRIQAQETDRDVELITNLELIARICGLGQVRSPVPEAQSQSWSNSKYDLMCQVPGPLVGCLPDAEVYFRGQMVGVCGERGDREAGSQAGSDRFKER